MGLSTQPGTPSARVFTFDDGFGVGATSWAPSAAATSCLVRYNPWGQAINAISSSNPCNSGSTVDNFLYHNARQDTSSQLLQMGARTYNPGTASFTGPDEYLASTSQQDTSVGVDPLTLNRYNYVNSDPINLIDPTGHYEIADDGMPQGAELDTCACDDSLGVGNTDPTPAPATYEPLYNGGRSLPVVAPPSPSASGPTHSPSTLDRLGNAAGAAGQILGVRPSADEAQGHLIAIGQGMDSGWRARYVGALSGARDWTGGEVADLQSGDSFRVMRGTVGAVMFAANFVPIGEGATVVRLGGEQLIPHGFTGAEEFAQFASRLRSGLGEAGYSDTRAAFQGSSVTGVSYRTGAAFDVGRRSDYDIALAGSDIFRAAQDGGIGLRSGGLRTGPLTAVDIEQLGLTGMRAALSDSAGRDVNFMIFRSLEDALARSPSIEVP